MNLNIDIPDKLLFFINEKSRYKIAYGGRGAGKSETIARLLLVMSIQRKLRILCTREFQNSISDSVMKLLSDLITSMKLDSMFTVTQTSIRNINGSEFLFKGLKKNINEIKSLQGVDYVWVEEAERVSEESWRILIPTIRKPESEIWVIFNPERDDSSTYKRFVKSPPPESIVQKINYYDNPWFPDVLRKEMEHDKLNDYDKYLNVWEGEIKRISDALVFKNKYIIEGFATPDIENIHEKRFFYGVDWGFSQDPTVVTRLFIKDNCLYIDYEAGGINIDMDDIETHLFEKIPDIKKGLIYADSARPETISYIRKKGYNINPCKKYAGSVEDGITYLKNFSKIYIHNRCKNAAYEFNSYSYKVDKVSGEILPKIEDKNNHYIDSIRYALDRYIQSKGNIVMF